MLMRQLLRSAVILAGLSALNGAVAAEAASWPDASEVGHNVAIIGAGAAGSSAAYYLHKFAVEAGIVVNITIFERTERVGGRTLTVNVFDNPLEPVELGASIFIKANHVLWNATQRLGLPSKRAGSNARGLMTVWDGDKFVFEHEQEGWEWWNLAKLIWKYGMAPRRTQTLMRSTIAKFMKLYEAPFFPFRSLTQRAFELGLSEVTAQTGQQLLAKNGISQVFANDIVQASTRVNYASNLGDIHGLDTMVAMAPEGAVCIHGGNWQIFDGMVHESKATLLLNTSISSIHLEPLKQPGMVHERFMLKTTAHDGSADGEEEVPVIFNKVIIASPYQFSNITASGDVMQHPIEEIPYVTLHVTLFTSPFQISPEFYNRAPVTRVPTTILTTLAESDDPAPGASGAGKAGFFSVQTRRMVTNPSTFREEYLYHIFSPEEITPDFLSSMLGVKVPQTFTRATNETAELRPDSVDPISWYFPHVFHSYPQARPRVTFQDPIIRAGLFYTSGMEAFISTMETNALMGMNVARLIIDDLLESPGSSQKIAAPILAAEDQRQRTMGGKWGSKSDGEL